MYLPAHFTVADRARLAAVIHEHSFATVVTQDGGAPFASHVPVLFFPERGAQGVLAAHVARANPHWRHLTGDREALVIFQGPHAYVSPAWYRTAPAVPTWNYVAVHAYGRPRLLETESELEALLQATVGKYESAMPSPWRAELPPEFRSRQLKAIVGFEIDITRLEGKFKLNQNRPREDIAGVIRELSASERASDREVAALMAEFQAQNNS
jgi:transcriptional regulator